MYPPPQRIDYPQMFIGTLCDLKRDVIKDVGEFLTDVNNPIESSYNCKKSK